MVAELEFHNFIEASPAYRIFDWLPSFIFQREHWPSLNEYNALMEYAPHPIRNAQGIPLQCVPQAGKPIHFEDYYEPSIYLKGALQTRDKNWHDFFNWLIWCTFPTLKKSINQLHFQQMQIRIEKKRSRIENFLTLLDENGLIIVSSKEYILNHIQNMEWKSLFWEARSNYKKTFDCFVVGHSLHEKFLNPYIGMVGHALLLPVAENFFSQPIRQQVDYIEKQFVYSNARPECFIDLSMPIRLYPVPLLGFPGWHKFASDETFYENKAYFRKNTAIT